MRFQQWTTKYNDIQQVFGEQAWVPVVRGEKDAKTAVSDAKTQLSKGRYNNE